jgi:hypothetical protein
MEGMLDGIVEDGRRDESKTVENEVPKKGVGTLVMSYYISGRQYRDMFGQDTFINVLSEHNNICFRKHTPSTMGSVQAQSRVFTELSFFWSEHNIILQPNSLLT